MGMRTLRSACEADAAPARRPASDSPGRAVHFPRRTGRGAIAKQFVRPPDWDEFRRLQDCSLAIASVW